ncbi:MAG: DUF4388 domain-containing protein [Nitrospirota bacterium]|nr:DUF4388 domain-containing protein [Nitrospirota bacterium]
MNESAQQIPDSGQLGTLPLIHILEHFVDKGVTGTLAVHQDAVVKAIFLRDGEVVFATSTKKMDRLGEVLVRTGVISASAHDAATKSMQQSGKREGETLVDMGILTPKGLFEALKVQVEEIILSMFLWDQGKYQFMPGRLPAHVVPLPVRMDQLLPRALDRLGGQ